MPTSSSLLTTALASDCVLLSTAGRHAKKDLPRIINEKSNDIRTVGHTVWLVNSNKGAPDKVQRFCAETGASYVLFVAPKSMRGTGTGGPPTAISAKKYSLDNKEYDMFDPRLGEVTGYIKQTTTGLWMDQLEKVDPPHAIDFDQYREYADPEQPVRFGKSDNAIPAIKVAHTEGEIRRWLLAVGHLATPFAVWLKA